jgi:sigma-B regulation protein RsbU (phosphoserine phosphatase)
MKFRWKLSLLMLAVSILPIVLLRAWGIHNVRNMADALEAEVQKGRLEAARNDIQASLSAVRGALNMERERVSIALVFLSDLLRRGRIEEGAGFRGLASKPCVMSPDPPTPLEMREADRLMQAGATFAAIAEHLGDLALRQDVAYANGVWASYPCPHPGLHAGDGTRQDWYRAAFVESVFSWSKPFWDDAIRRWQQSVSALWEDDDGQPLGVASVTVAIDRLLERILAFANLPDSARAFLCMLEPDPANGAIGLRVLLEADTPPPSGPQWLSIADAGLAATVVDDVARRTPRIVRMAFAERDAFWAYTPLPYQGSALVLIVPAADLLAPTQPVQAAIRSRLRGVEMLTAGFLVLLAVVNAAVVLTLSRSVTRPLETLAKASDRLAAGDFNARVQIASKDEFGSMGTIFNRVGPQLKEHFRVREALHAAVEIQQSLLPRAQPRVPALDIHALSL